MKIRHKAADRLKAGKRFLALMDELGIEPGPCQIYEDELFKDRLMKRDDEIRSKTYRTETRHGPLDITLDVCPRMVSIFMRFDEPDRAWDGLMPSYRKTIGTGLNPHSGKWNIHIEDVDVAMTELELRLVGRCGLDRKAVPAAA